MTAISSPLAHSVPIPPKWDVELTAVRGRQNDGPVAPALWRWRERDVDVDRGAARVHAPDFGPRLRCARRRRHAGVANLRASASGPSPAHSRVRRTLEEVPLQDRVGQRVPRGQLAVLHAFLYREEQ